LASGHSLEVGLRQTIDWYKKNKGWVADVRAGEYLSYYEKYYDNRDRSLRLIAGLPARSFDRP
jgi:hypothetical protein